MAQRSLPRVTGQGEGLFVHALLAQLICLLLLGSPCYPGRITHATDVRGLVIQLTHRSSRSDISCVPAKTATTPRHAQHLPGCPEQSSGLSCQHADVQKQSNSAVQEHSQTALWKMELDEFILLQGFCKMYAYIFHRTKFLGNFQRFLSTWFSKFFRQDKLIL